MSINTTYSTEFVVVTHSRIIQELTTNQVKMLYRGLISNINGQTITLADLPLNSKIRESFYLTLLGKTPSQMQALRARQNFSGRHIPPYELSSSNKKLIQKWLSNNPEGIIYIPKEWQTSDLRVVYQFDSEEEVE
ncbi:hypothetical protein [Vibrio salinus]|uniref:hypothetical protein n=1 Tax=Vibrio salinus TaxID=2899784 RepID=UPI001E4A9CAF|nr:hypothetical protein [Vibrio salinus]MCE0495326.1 hypothetical protein [Vibrio salinus]